MPGRRRTSRSGTRRAALTSVPAVLAIVVAVVVGFLAATGAMGAGGRTSASAAGVVTATQTVTVTATVTATATVRVPGPTRTVTATPSAPEPTAAATSPQTAPPAPAVRSSTLFGAFPGFTSLTDLSEPFASRVARVTAEFGGKVGVERIYRGGNLTLPTMTKPAIVSWDFPLAGTLAGQHDAQIDAIARGATQPLWFVPWHEVDNHKMAPADYVALFRYIANRVHAVGNPLVKMTPLLMGFTVRNMNVAAFDRFYPGDAYADAIGFDTFINPGIPSMATPESAEAAPIKIAAEHHKPLVIGEVSLYAGYSDAQWTDFVRRLITLLDTPGTDAVSWFETTKADGDWRMARHPQAVAEWAAVSSR